jgi:hypothetical protein
VCSESNSLRLGRSADPEELEGNVSVCVPWGGDGLKAQPADCKCQLLVNVLSNGDVVVEGARKIGSFFPCTAETCGDGDGHPRTGPSYIRASSLSPCPGL